MIAVNDFDHCKSKARLDQMLYFSRQKYGNNQTKMNTIALKNLEGKTIK